jgi:DNA polymerase (family 10)
MTNAGISERLLALAQLLAAQKENPYKIKAYRRAARTIAEMPDNVEDLVRSGRDLTEYAGIGASISDAVREIVERGWLERLETLKTAVSPEIASLSQYPLLDPARVSRIYKKLKISSVDELKQALKRGDIVRELGARMEQHIRDALAPQTAILLYDAHRIAGIIQNFLLTKCGAVRAEVAGEYRRRIEVVRELSFVVDADDFAAVSAKVQRYGGTLPLRVTHATKRNWGPALIAATGPEEHVRALGADVSTLSGATEESVYRELGLSFIPPELREGPDEVRLAAEGALPKLVNVDDIHGDLHAHTTASDGANTIEEMAAAARDRGYEYLGITDHSQSLTIARGVSIADLRLQLRAIDKLNNRLTGMQVLKSAEVDILEDGSLDYPDDLLKELDYTVCSIHSRFGLGRSAQTQRILRAMDNPYFTILGHATGRKLLRRPGYEIDVERVIEQARKNGCFIEINSSPDRLDFSAANARLARDAGIKIAVNTDAHSTGEFEFINAGIEQARRAGLEKTSVLNCMRLADLRRAFRR